MQWRSAYTQVKLENAPRLLKIPESECPDVWIRLPRHKWPKSWASIEDPVVPLERNFVQSSFSRIVVGKRIRRSFITTCMGESTKLMTHVRSSETRVISVSFFWMTLQWLQKKQNVAPMWKKLMKNVDFGEPISFFDHENLGCAQRECKPNENTIERYTKMFESRISARTIDKLPGWQNTHAQTVAWSYDMEGHARKCVERYLKLANKKAEQL